VLEKGGKHLKLCISSQWNDEFLLECAKHHVHEVYCSFRTGAIGSARPAVVLPQTSFEQAKNHVDLAHSLGMEFSYVVNAPCLGNMEYDFNGRNKIRAYLEMIDALGVDSITLAIPYLIEIVKKDFPRMKIKVSEIANVSTAQRAKYYEKMGADVITLEIVANRDFKVLESIYKAVSNNVELEVVVNAACLYQCPYHDYHNNIVGHTGQEDHELHGYYMDYCMMRCIPTNLTNSKELIKARWIRPEDIHYYEEIGISRFKISNRVGPIHLGSNCLKAYSSRKCDDIARLLTPLSLNLEKPAIERLVGFTEEEWEKVVKIWDVRPPKIHIDNKQLEGFIDYFKNGLCYGQCDEGGCTYCAQVAEKVVRVDTEAVNEYAQMVQQLLEPLLSLKGGGPHESDSNNQSYWTEEVNGLFEKLIEHVPSIFKDVAITSIRGKAQELANEKGHKTISQEDLIRAFLEDTPAVFKDDLKKIFAELELSQYVS